jgi:lysophospholipase L1-like esterase
MTNKNRLGKVILSAVGLAVACLICEIIVRLADLAPEVVYIEKWRVRLSDNPKIGFEPIPNLDSTGKPVQYYAYHGQSNDDGFRDYNHSLHKPDGSRRIAIIGDSVTAGLWINDDTKVYPAVMEKHLQNLGFSVDVMNLGVAGYNTQQEVEMLKDKGLKFNPDLVILAYCLNDRFNDDGGIYGFLLAEEQQAQKDRNQVNIARLNSVLQKSDLIRFLRFGLFKPGKKAGPAPGDGEQFNKDTVSEYFAELKRLSTKNSFEVLVFIFPDFGHHDENLKNYATYQFLKDHENIINLAKSHGFAYLDLFDIMQKCHNQLGYPVSYDRYHLNPAGSQCAGRAMAEHVAQMWRRK